MWKSKLSNNNTEQSSTTSAEDTLPKTTSHEYCINQLKSVGLNPDEPNAMCFYAPDNSVFIGLLLEETEDSFLVGASAIMRMDRQKNVTTEEVSPQPVVRWMKNSVRYVVRPTEMTVYYYFAFLQEFGYNKLPDYFTDGMKTFISQTRDSSRYNRPQPLALQPVETKPEVPGDSEHSFVPYIQSESVH